MTTAPARLRAVALAGLFLGLWAVLLSGAIAAAQSARPMPRHAQDTILVRFTAAAPPSELAQAHALAVASGHRSFTLVAGHLVVRVPLGMIGEVAIGRNA